MQRRKFLSTSAVVSVGRLVSSTLHAKEQKITATTKLKHNINHSACYWCYNSIPLEAFLKNLNEQDLKAIDLVGPEDWPLLKRYDIHASMCWAAEISLTEGWSDLQYHQLLVKSYTEMIPKVAAAGYTNLICFSGNRNGMDDLVGLRNCAQGLKQLMPMAE